MLAATATQALHGRRMSLNLCCGVEPCLRCTYLSLLARLRTEPRWCSAAQKVAHTGAGQATLRTRKPAIRSFLVGQRRLSLLYISESCVRMHQRSHVKAVEGRTASALGCFTATSPGRALFYPRKSHVGTGTEDNLRGYFDPVKFDRKWAH